MNFKTNNLWKNNTRRSDLIYKTGATAETLLGKNIKVIEKNDSVGICH